MVMLINSALLIELKKTLSFNEVIKSDLLVMAACVEYRAHHMNAVIY